MIFFQLSVLSIIFLIEDHVASAFTSPLGKWRANDNLSLPTEHPDHSVPSRGRNHSSCCAHLWANEPLSLDTSVLGKSEHTFLTFHLPCSDSSFSLGNFLAFPTQSNHTQSVACPICLARPGFSPATLFPLAAI